MEATATSSAVNIPIEQWAQVLEEVGSSVQYKKIPVPQPGPEDVLVHVRFSGVCHTDLHTVHGDWPMKTKLPLVGGHEGAGVVAARGALVRDVEIGERVGIKWINGSCLNCSYCHTSDEPLCRDAIFSGFAVDGTFQQYAVARAAHVARLPPGDDGDLAAVAPILCAGITVYRGLKESGARPGQTVAIVGAGGGLGSLAVQFARAMGLIVIAVDAGASKRDECMRLGASTFIDFNEAGDNVPSQVTAACSDGIGPHAVVVVAVHETPFRQAVEYVRPRGTVICIGLPPKAQLVAPLLGVVIRMVNIKGSYVGNRADTAEALEFFRRGLVRATHTVIGLSKLQDVFQMMQDGNITGRYVLDTSC